MAKVIVGAKLEVDSSGANQSVKDFRQQLQEASSELKKVQTEFGQLSPQALEAAERVSELRGRIDEINEASGSFDMERKAEALGRSVMGVTGGFSALQGVMALVGTESEEVERQLLKVQAALAISQGVADVMDAMKGFQALGQMIKSSTAYQLVFNAATKTAAIVQKAFGISVDTTSTSFKVLRGAIIATGVGALVVALGFAIEKLSSLASASDEAAKKQQELAASMQKAESAALKAGLGFLESDKQLAVARAKAKGASEAEIFAIEQHYTDMRIEQMQKFVGKTEDNNALLDEIEAEKNQKEIAALNRQAEINRKAQEQQKAASDKAIEEAKRKREELENAAKKQNEELRRENEAASGKTEQERELIRLRQEFNDKKAIAIAGGQSLLEVETWYNREKAAINKKYRDEEHKQQIEAIDAQLAKEQEAAQKQIDSRNKSYNAIKEAAVNLVNEESLSYEHRRQLIDEAEQRIADSAYYTEAQKTAMKKAFSDARTEVDRKELEAKWAMQDAEASLIDAASELAGRQTVAGKALAIAATTISTYTAAQKAYESQFVPLPTPDSPVRGAIAAATAVIGGLAKVKSIIGVQIPGKSSGGGSVPAANMNTSAPLRPQLATPTQLDQSTINKIGNHAIKAYVIESDVANESEKIRRLNRAARL